MAFHKYLLIFIVFFADPDICHAIPHKYKDHIPVAFVNDLPSGTSTRVAVISCRNFKPGHRYMIRHGSQPRLNMFSFIAEKGKDTAYVKPVREFSSAVLSLPADHDFIVYVHGHGKTFDQVLERGFELSRRFNMNVVVFDWASDNFFLKETRFNAQEVSVNFVKAMMELNQLHREFFSGVSVSAIFHSMGNYILKDIVDEDLLHFLPEKMFSNIIINAAAVSQFRHVQWVEKLNIQRRIYITLNEKDRVLHASMILQSTRQLGNGFKGKRAGNAVYVNFSDMATFSHNLFLGRSEAEKNNGQIFRFFNEAFHGNEVMFTSGNGFREKELGYYAATSTNPTAGSGGSK